MSKDEKSNFADWWFLNGGGIHRAVKSEDAAALADYAKCLPKLAWDEQQKTIDILSAELELLRKANGRLVSAHEVLNEALGATSDEVIKLQERLARVVEGSKILESELANAKLAKYLSIDVSPNIRREVFAQNPQLALQKAEALGGVAIIDDSGRAHAYISVPSDDDSEGGLAVTLEEMCKLRHYDELLNQYIVERDLARKTETELAAAKAENARFSAHHDKVCDDRELIWNQRDEARAELAAAKVVIEAARALAPLVARSTNEWNALSDALVAYDVKLLK